MTTTPTVFVVYCPTHRHYLVRASVGGTTWSDDQTEARRYETKPAARKAADLATWLDHDPHPWPIGTDTTYTLEGEPTYTLAEDEDHDDDDDPRDGIDYAWEADYRQHSSSHTGLYEAP